MTADENKKIEITDCFGRSKAATLYIGAYDGRDGWACPFCASVAVNMDRCQNPACCASPWAKPEAIVEQAHTAALMEEEQRRRMAIHTWAMERIAEEQKRREEVCRSELAEASRRGACENPACLWPGYRQAGYVAAKFVVHRKDCPRGRRLA